MKAILERIHDDGVQTLGILKVYKEDNLVYKCTTLELPWKENENKVSCIPTGTYKVRLRDGVKENSSVAHYTHYEVTNVDNRSWILIHKGNYNTDILGCILIGKGFTFLNNDDKLDVYSSSQALSELLIVAPEGFELLITSK